MYKHTEWCRLRQRFYIIMKKQRQRILSAFLLSVLTFTTAAAQTKVTVFSNPTTFRSASAYTRIPSIARLHDGTLLAITDARYNNGQDLGKGYDTANPIDLFGKTSSDNGATWSTNILDVMVGDHSITDATDSGFGYAHGDAASVVDRETGKIMVLAASGRHGFFGNGLYPLVGRAYSTNGGSSFDKTNISTQLYQNSSSVGHLFFSSGRMIQSTKVKKGSYYRVYAAVDTRPGGSRVVYSDDFGETWNYLGGIAQTPASSGDECKVEELPNGNILLSCRTQSGTGRYFNIFTFTNAEAATGSWGSVQHSNNTNGGTYAASCNAEILLVPAKRVSDGKKLYVLLQSAAMSDSRQNVGIYYKVLTSESDYDSPSDFTSGWSKYQVSTTTSCYSTMVLDRNGDIAFYYEENNIDHDGGTYDMQFKSLPLTTITSNQYAYCRPDEGSYVPTSDPSWGTVFVSDPEFGLASGEYEGAQTVTITCATSDATIYYTTDGTTPTTTSNKYEAPLTITASTTLKAIAIDSKGNESDVVTANYTIYAPTISTPELSVASGTYTTSQTVEISCATSGVTIYYTLDGTTPTSESLRYETPLTIEKNTTLKAIAIDGEGNASKVVTANYRIQSPDDDILHDGKTGTTIRIDGNSCHPLYSSGATSNSTTQFFSFLRHDIAHVQLVSANKSALSTAGFESFQNVANDMLFTKDSNKYLQLHNYGGNASIAYYAVIAPKGYRFIRYQWDIDEAHSTAGASLTQYTYDESGDVVLGDNSVTVAADMEPWDVTLSNGTNVLYFQYNTGGTTNATPLTVKSLKLTYAIDQPFEAILPNSDASANIHTGLLDPGEFSDNDKSIWTFKESNISDLQEVNVYEGSTKVTPSATTVDGTNYYFTASKDGDYYVEAPEKFRIVGAKLQVMCNNVGGVASIEDGKQYVLTDGYGHYLNNNGGTISNGSDISTATKWTIKKANNGYTIQNGNDYLYHNDKFWNHTLSLNNSSSSWSWDSSNGFYYTYSWSTTYHLTYNSGWELTMSSSNKAKPAVNEGSFTATPYTRDNQPMAAQTLDLSEANPTATMELEDFNNDAIHFRLSGLPEGSTALYAVSLQLLPLNPELQNLSVASRLNDGTELNTTSFTAENYAFNGGKEVAVVIPATETSCTALFKNAYNEERTQWYTEGTKENNTASKGGYSNYFLVNSTADNGGATNVLLNAEATPYAAARVNADQAGQKQLAFTNIANIYNINKSTNTFSKGDSYLVDNDFSKTEATYGEAKLTATDEGKCIPYYVYVADQPTWNILPASIGAKHIDYRYFSLNLCCVRQNEEPVVTLTPIYKETLKGKNHKNANIASDGNKLDTEHTFYGVTVTSKPKSGTGTALGYLTSAQVVDAIQAQLEALNNGCYGFGKDDAFRGALYIDMSSLKSVDYDRFDETFNNSTADNCLYFMYPGFHRDNIQNVVAKTAEDKNTFEAVSNIVVKDQQPFFTPYDFATGTYTVSYERESTNGKAKVKQMAVVLPFDVPLNGTGSLKTATDVIDNTVTYHDINSSGELKEDADGGRDMLYAVVAKNVTEATAKANEPYYVTTEKEGFSYRIAGTKFRKTPDALKRTNGTWTGVGTYCGVTPAKADDLWYFSKEYFWKSGSLTAFNVVNVLPFRSYYLTTDKTTYSQAGWTTNEGDVIPAGIHDVNAAKGLTIAAGHGFIALTAAEDAPVQVYTVAGQLVANYDLTAGETRRAYVAQGVYLVNGVKVVVR